MSARPGSAVMLLINEITELAERIKDLGKYTEAKKTTMSRAEATAIVAQADAMGQYSKSLEVRLKLLGVDTS